jgi:hypothetical protein
MPDDPRDIVASRNEQRANAARRKFSKLREKLAEGLSSSRSVHMMTREDEGDVSSHRGQFRDSAFSHLHKVMTEAEAALSPDERAVMPKKRV